MTASDPPLRRNYDRKGFGLGTAILSASQLKEVHTLIKQAHKRLNDPSLQILRDGLEERLSMAGIDITSIVPTRSFANRSIIDPKEADSRSMAHIDQLGRLEDSILNRHQIWCSPMAKPADRLTVWPLQLLFYHIAWYLAYEAEGRISVERLDRLRLIKILRDQQRSVKDMRVMQKRLLHLCRRTGGIYMGDNLHWQRQLGRSKLGPDQIQSLLKEGGLVKVRFHCTAFIYRFIREGNNRYPREQMFFSQLLPDENWAEPGPPSECVTLTPNIADSHPYPVELLLPCWTVDSIDFTRWLFGFGSEVRIELPETLRKKHLGYGAGIASLYDTPSTEE